MSFNFGSWLRGVWGNNTLEPKLFIDSGGVKMVWFRPSRDVGIVWF